MRVKSRCKSVDKGLERVFAAIAQRNLLLIAITLGQGLGNFLQFLIVELHAQYLRLEAAIPQIVLGRLVDGPSNVFTFDLYDFIGGEV